MTILLCVMVLGFASSAVAQEVKFTDTQAAKLAAQVKQEFLHGWTNYETYAWGHDELKPLSRTPKDWYGPSLLMTPVDGLDTLIVMHLDGEAKKTRALIDTRLSFDSLDTRSGGGANTIVNAYNYRVEFTIDSAYTFDFVSDITNGSGSWNDEQGYNLVSGVRADGDSVFIGPGESGVLQPGTYTLTVQQSNQRISTGDPDLTSAFRDYNYSFALAPVDSGGGPNPIPLPPAVWSGLAVLGAGAFTRIRCRLHM